MGGAAWYGPGGTPWYCSGHPTGPLRVPFSELFIKNSSKFIKIHRFSVSSITKESNLRARRARNSLKFTEKHRKTPTLRTRSHTGKTRKTRKFMKFLEKHGFSSFLRHRTDKTVRVVKSDCTETRFGNDEQFWPFLTRSAAVGQRTGSPYRSSLRKVFPNVVFSSTPENTTFLGFPQNDTFSAAPWGRSTENDSFD